MDDKDTFITESRKSKAKKKRPNFVAPTHDFKNSNKISLRKSREIFMQEAIQLAIENVTSNKRRSFGAVVVKDGKIIARGVQTV
jgi:deoxycytidylate deaminase